jgi:hypothetical protein
VFFLVKTRLTRKSYKILGLIINTKILSLDKNNTIIKNLAKPIEFINAIITENY